MWLYFQVGRAGRFGTRGFAITFVSSQSDAEKMNSVQDRFEVGIQNMPSQIDASLGLYLKATLSFCF